GCPVITCKNSSIPEVAGRAALYINDNDVNGLVNALGEVQKSEVKQQLISAGLAQAQKFSWSQMAKIMTDVFIQTFNRIKVKELSAMEDRKNLGEIQFEINHGQLEMQRHFWNVNSLDKAMFEGVFTDNKIHTMSPQEKMEAWESKAPNFTPATERLQIVLNKKRKSQLSWDKFQDFTYSKRSHFKIFDQFDFYKNIHPDAADLKFYQDTLVYNFITQNLPPGAKLLEIGGGNSRIIEALKSKYECWNIDKLKGQGNGPTNIKTSTDYRLVLDYIGNFNILLPNNYFDCVFSISTLEHLPEDERTFLNVCDDINRVLKPDGISLHCLDIVIKKTFVWTRGILPYIFKNIQTLNQMVAFEKMQQDSDLYVMSEFAYQRHWQSITKQSYREFGQPVSYNILWQKTEKFVSPNVIVKQPLPKISIVTPSLNQGEFLEECIDSILCQNYPNLEYIIMDGGSTDNSVEIIKKYEKYLTYWQSQSDGGHYSAINLGFNKATGKIMAWLNSDDKYHPDAFFKVVAAFEKNQEIEWIMGRPTQWNKNGKLEYISQNLPPWSRAGLLNKDWEKYNQWIQQESTFWQRSLWEKIGSKLSTEFQFAGDFELWMRCSRYAQLFVIDTLIGGFRYYQNQRSQKFKNQYLEEVEKILVRELNLISEGQFTNSQPAPKPVQVISAEINLVKQQVPIKNNLVIVTSIAPGNEKNQLSAIESWQKFGFTVVSLNNQAEINNLESIYKDVTFYPVKRDAKTTVGRPLVYVDDLILYLKQYGTKICGIINSDIRLEAGENFLSFISQQAENSVIFGSRVDIDSFELTGGEIYQRGFDIFFFDKVLLEEFPISKFCLGLPWWDLWIPSMAIKKGLKSKYLATPIFYHLKHKINYSNDFWQTMGIHFAEFFNLDLSKKFQQILVNNPSNLQFELTQMAENIVTNIHRNTDIIVYKSQAMETSYKMQPINAAQLILQREFWNVNSLDEAMFGRVLAYSGIDTLSPEEKRQAWENSIENWMPQILEGIPVKPEWKVLEVGCGVGRLIKYLREKFARVDGVDISENMIQFAREYLADGKQNGEVFVNNGYDLQELSDEYYDFVFSTIVFQHIRSISIVKSYFREIFRILKLGGYFRIQVHDYSAKSLGNFDEEGAKDKQYYFSGNAYTEEQLKDLLVAAGFNLVSLKSAKPWIWATVRREPKVELAVEKFPQIATLKNNQMGIEYPEINPLSDNNHRPFWSVVIPTYKKVKYLEQTLKSVLQQAPSPEEMQIEVINDCPDVKIQTEIEAIVRKVGGERINFYRHFPQDIGQAPIFNICLQRAQGYWVHLLHDDDFILPGFYENLRQVIEKNTTVGAAFSRHYYIDENDNQKMVSPLEKETPGIIPNWLEKIVVMQRIQCASIVVKRSVYEKLGGFCPEANSAADWEMWKRIATYYSVGYQPQPLACYRLHSASESTRLIKFGGNIADTRKSIEISESYLPPEKAKKLSTQAREHYAISATQIARQMLKAGKLEVAIAQIQEALKCSESSQVKEGIISLFISSDSTLEINTTQLLSEVSKYVEEYQKDFSNQSVLDNLRQLRQKIANYWLNLPTEKLESAYLGDVGKANQKLIGSSLKYEKITDTEKSLVKEIENHITQGLYRQNSIQYLLAATLYYYPHQLSPNWYEQAPIPKWFVNDYIKFMIDAPSYFQEIGEADNFYRYTFNWTNYLHQRIFGNSDSKIWQDIAWFFTQKSNFIPLYFNNENLKDIYIKRAEIMELALETQGFKLNYVFPQRPTNRNKIRLGIISNHFIPQTETFSTLPFFEHLDKTKFEIILYSKNLTEYPLEKYCQSRAERFVKLPDNLSKQVETIRADDLDILLIGTNITAITNPITLLALHRLARIQLTSTSSCVTTGMRHIDYYISGKLTEPQQQPQQQYREKLITLKNTAHCFNYYATQSEKPVVKPTRESWGVTDKNIVFVSGANFYKIIPELRETWAKIIAAVPNSVLVLYPFNPNWSNTYQASIHFVNDLRSTFNKYSIDKKRLIVIKTLPSRSDIKECLKLCNVYLDSYPFAGVNSLIEPLEIGIPIITKNGNSFRSLMGSSLLRSLSIPDLIVNNEAEYINLAIQLANNSEFRQQKRQEIQEKMQQNPSFLDSHAYSAQIGELFQKLFQEWQNIHAPKTIESTGENSLTSEFINRLIGCVNLYEIDPTDQSLIEELRQIRKQIADFWLSVAPKELETTYQGKIRQAYQALLKSGIQNEPQTEDEQKFLQELAETSMGLTNPKAINTLLGAMLYFPPSKMLVRDAKNRLPQWLIDDYKQIFESREVAEKLEKTFKSKSPHLPENYSVTTAEVKPEKNVVLTANQTDDLDISQQKFINQLLGSVNLYYIDPSDESVVQELRQIRKQMADFWINLEPQKLENFYLDEMGKGYQALLNSKIQNQSLIESEQEFLQQLAAQLSQGIEAPKAINYLLAAMLYCRSEQLRIEDITKLPNWLLEDYQKFAGNC
ncbi:MAG: glycosyltransferase, partial [Okeania sp. SIO3C4]|nr:glycosyltransferase [Okeania sp. SIO3C4]